MHRLASLPLFLTAGCLFVLAGCPKEPAKKPEPAPEKKPLPPAKTSTQASASDPTSCVGGYSAEGEPTKVTAGGHQYELRGNKLTELGEDADDQIIFGVLANVKEDTPENLKNLATLLERFKAEKVDVILVDGDVGESESQVVNVMTPIAASGLPTFVVIGNREKKADFDAGVKAVQAKHPNLFNMNAVRLAVLDDAALVSLPGYWDPSYTEEGGCAYKPSDVEATKGIVRAAGERTIVLLSHGGPRQEGADAIDRMAEQANVGDPEVGKLLRETGVKFGVFANIVEAGGRATNIDGTQLIGEGKMAAELYLNPGPVDSVVWKMNDRTESQGMGALLTIKGKMASYKMIRLGVK